MGNEIYLEIKNGLTVKENIDANLPELMKSSKQDIMEVLISIACREQRFFYQLIVLYVGNNPNISDEELFKLFYKSVEFANDRERKNLFEGVKIAASVFREQLQ